MITDLALLGSVLGSLLISFRDRRGFYFWFFANCFWFFDSFNRNDMQQCILWGYYNLTCIIGIIRWKN